MALHSFPSKILLFGEYTILLGSKALAIPYPHFSGHLEVVNHDYLPEKEKQKFLSFEILKSFYNYIIKTIDHTDLVDRFDNKKFVSDLEKSLSFNSSIPNGFGLGSSGALTAAVYDRYFNASDRNNIDHLLEIKKHLAYLESFFHQSSSGIDPLVSYCNRPLLLQNDCIDSVKLPGKSKKQFSTFLVNTQIKRSAANLVADFLKKCENISYLYSITSELITANNACIDAIMEENTEMFFQHLQQLSEFQFHNFKTLIPNPILPFWEKGLHTGQYYLKICGAGGGGYLLGFTRIENLFSENKQQQIFDDFRLLKVEY